MLQDFIIAHHNDDIRQLALQASRYPDIDMPFAIQQIDGWQRARHKLPMWANCDNIIYPPHISMEQCSSEQTAIYKQQLAKRLTSRSSNTSTSSMSSKSSNTSRSSTSSTSSTSSMSSNTSRSSMSSNTSSPSTLYDLTGGFGVDFSYMSQVFDKAIYIEQQQHLCDIARNNLSILNLTNTEIICGNSTDTLSTLPDRTNNTTTVIYLDPARRDTNGHKTYAISDCTPDVISLLPTLKQKADIIIIKLSPMLDHHEAMRLLTGITEIHIISVNNECKEILLVINQKEASNTNKNTDSSLSSPLLYCVNDSDVFITTANATFISPITNNCIAPVSKASAFDLIGSTLYIPNASIMKAGCFQALSQRFSLLPLDNNSHLFISSENAIDSFPGRSFTITAVSSMNKKELKHTLAGITQANIAIRNFPLSADALRKKLSLKDGGNIYIFATTIAKNHILLICQKGATQQAQHLLT